MASPVGQDAKTTLLRERITRFLANHSARKVPLHQALQRIEQKSWSAVIFGGVLRDLLVFGNSERPRDVDVVVRDANFSELELVFRDLIYEKTRFGGLRLRAKGWLIDVWALPDTWAFRQGLMPRVSFDHLVQTTFLDVEAAAVEIAPHRGRPRKFYSAGFFEAIERQVLDINLEPNPFPALCAVRSIITALRLDFALSRRLAEYVVRYASRIPIEELTETQESHYGKLWIAPTRMLEFLNYIEDQLRESSTEVVRLPKTRPEQLELLRDWMPTN